MRLTILSLVLFLLGCQPLSENGVSYFSRMEGSVNQRSTSYYANFLNAAQSGAVETGRLPAWVPPSATAINESHSVDTVQSLLAFDFDPADLAAMTETCEPVAPEAIQFPALNVDWWPPDLREAATASRYTFFDCYNEMGYLAVLPEGKAYFWVP